MAKNLSSDFARYTLEDSDKKQDLETHIDALETKFALFNKKIFNSDGLQDRIAELEKNHEKVVEQLNELVCYNEFSSHRDQCI